MSLKDLLGGKGANLAEMTSVLELPVPPGFTISTDACRDYMAGGWPAGLTEEVERQGKLRRKSKAKQSRRPAAPRPGGRASAGNRSKARTEGHVPQLGL